MEALFSKAFQYFPKLDFRSVYLLGTHPKYLFHTTLVLLIPPLLHKWMPDVFLRRFRSLYPPPHGQIQGLHPARPNIPADELTASYPRSPSSCYRRPPSLLGLLRSDLIYFR
ncbi:hypothetical protein BGS_0144 [Beggiatoa sp. SS]|nr:hypothetical protein BGS_0144 [Beggiatoa sp. SS]